MFWIKLLVPQTGLVVGYHHARLVAAVRKEWEPLIPITVVYLQLMPILPARLWLECVLLRALVKTVFVVVLPVYNVLAVLPVNMMALTQTPAENVLNN